MGLWLACSPGQADEVELWAQAVRKTMFCCEYFSSGSEVEVMQKAIQAREDIKKNNEGMARTAMGRIFEIVAACDMTGKIGVVASECGSGVPGVSGQLCWEIGALRPGFFEGSGLLQLGP